MALPFLPGMTFSDPTRTSFPKSHTFGDRPRPERPPVGSGALYPKAEATVEQVPSWMAFDRQVLRFNAYFKEAVHESAVEQFRVRKVVIFFFLEDDSIRVDEPKQENSGSVAPHAPQPLPRSIPQGQLLRRHRIPKPGGNGAFYTVQDFNLGQEVEFYGRVYRVTHCDDFTKRFLNKVGITVNEEEEDPSDEYLTQRAKAWWGGRMTGEKQREKPEADLKKFLHNDRKVLRFNAVWDDRSAVYGDRRLFLIHYFLADDTLEIKEVIPSNSGRDPVPQFMKRGKLPKRMGETLMADHLVGPPKSFYKLKDLRIGLSVSVYGRSFLLYDCDSFTQQYLHERYGISDFTPIDISEPQVELAKPTAPPPTGFGSDEDSLGSWHTLVPKPPKKDFQKMAREEGKVLRFAAVLDTKSPIDMDRRFVVSYQLATDQVQVFEQAQRNSGIQGGKFLGPGLGMKIKLPDGSRYYQPEDFYVGTTLELNKYRFILIDADEYALKYMEAHDNRFLQSNVLAIIAKIGEAIKGSGYSPQEAFEAFDRDASGALSSKEFRLMLKSLGFALTEHEILTLLRRFDLSGDGVVSLKEFASALN